MPRKTIQKNLAYDTERQLYYAVFRQDGRRYTRTYRTREEAQAALEGNSCADRRLPGKDCTLGEWLTFWLEEVVARDRAESTLYAYRNMARCHVLPALGRIPLAELTPLRIQGYLYEKMNQGLSPNTVIKHYVMLTTALGMAVRLEMLERSPMDRVTPPKKKEARFSFYSPEQLQLLFSAVSGTMMELPVKLAAYLGPAAQRDLRPAVGECGPGGGAALHPGGAHRGGRQRGAEVPQDPHLRPAAGHHRAPGPAAGAAAGVGEAAQRRPEGVGGAAAGRGAPQAGPADPGPADGGAAAGAAQDLPPRPAAQLCLGGQQPGRAHVRYLPHPGAQLHDRHQQHLHPPF